MRYLLLLAFLSLSIFNWAQPANNNCSGIIDLGVAPVCINNVYSNVDATPFDIDFENEPPCFVENPPQNDVWFSFTANGEDEDYVVKIKGIEGNPVNPLTSIQAAVYRGDCMVNSLAVFSCGASANGEKELTFEVPGTTPNDTYFIRVDNFGGDENEGDFTICVETDLNEYLVTDGGSTDCKGILYDSGGADGDYGDNENHVFTICPSEVHQCVTFNLEYYNIQSTAGDFFVGDYINFYDGDDTSAPEILSVGTDLQLNFDGGGGGVCLSVQASNCLTVQFTSDEFINFDGFKGFWECSFEPCQPLDAITIGSEPNTAEIEKVLSTSDGNVILKSINCPSEAYALFSNGDNTDLGIDKGILLTSGKASLAQGPNFLGNTEFEHFTPGDEDLNNLSILLGENFESFDACIVEVEVLALTNELNFEYIFASEEYPEFVNTQWNDIFALLISGPGIVGEAILNNKKNMAILEESQTLVQINSINNFENWEYYRNNQNGQSLEYDGMTSDKFGVKKSLTAKADVMPCNTYTLKFAIGDRSDAKWDSGVFISEINTGAPSLSFQFSSGQDYLIETCSVDDNFLVISLSQPLNDTIALNTDGNTLEITGTAELDVDYTLNIPDSLRFLPGETEIRLPITLVADQLEEGIESIIFTLINNQCGDIEVATLEGFISDKIEIEINGGLDTVQVCRNEELTVEATGGDNYSWEPAEFVSEPSSPNTTVSTDEDRWYFVTASIDGNNDPTCEGTDSIFVDVIGPEINISVVDTNFACQGDTIAVLIETDGDLSTLTWNMVEGVEDTLSLMTNIIPDFGNIDGVDYIVSIDSSGCTVSDTLTLFIAPFDFPSTFHADTTICQGDSIKLSQDITGSTTIYSWTPLDSISDPNVSGPVVFPSDTTTYQLIAMDLDGFCADTAEILVNVIPNFADITPIEDTILLCKGDSVFLTAINSGNGDLMWSPTDFLSDSTTTSVWAQPEVTSTVYLVLTGDVCSASDSVVIRVDSLPVLAIEAIPAKEVYCQGEIVTLISPGYDEDLYPFIQHNWNPSTGALDDVTKLNFPFSTVDTIEYIRRTINGACMSNDTILINVVVPDLRLSDTTACPGEPVNVLLMTTQMIDNISWSPGDPMMISCMDCINPTITVFQTTTFTANADVDGCPGSATMTMTVPGAAIGFDVSPGTRVGLGSDVSINILTNPDPGPNTIYTWTVNGETINQNGPNITITILEEMNEITVEYIDEFGCLRSAVLFIEGVAPRFVFPNAFSPGISQDVNDNFIPWFTTLEQWEMNNFFIYNRWGQKVFDCQDKDCFEMGWDGTYKDKGAPTGVYMYVFNYTLPNGDSKTQKGDITLFR